MSSKFADYDHWTASWEQAWQRVAHDDDWSAPWMRDVLGEGNPIFSAWSPRKRLGVRVVQNEDPGFEWYLDTAGEPGSEIRELVIACGLDEGVVVRFEDLVREWLRTATIAEETLDDHEVAMRSIDAAA